MAVQRWRVGRCTITSVLEEHVDHIPPEMFFPAATADAVAKYQWLVPDFADESGAISLRVQAFVIELGTRHVLVDPCVGNGKRLVIPYWNERTWPFMERFAEAGFDSGKIDTVVHTHLHADHVGWDTHLAGGVWVPTFPKARHLYTARELEYCRSSSNPGNDGVFADSIAPIMAAGLADVVDEDADLGDGLRLEPTTGHTPGHVSLWIESAGEVALISGDIMHHPVQCAEPDWAEIGDHDPEQARATRRRMLTRAAETRALVLVAHFGPHPAGYIQTDRNVWRFVPV